MFRVSTVEYCWSISFFSEKFHVAKSLSFYPINNGVRFVNQYHDQDINAHQLIIFFYMLGAANVHVGHRLVEKTLMRSLAFRKEYALSWRSLIRSRREIMLQPNRFIKQRFVEKNSTKNARVQTANISSGFLRHCIDPLPISCLLWQVNVWDVVDQLLIEKHSRFTLSKERKEMQGELQLFSVQGTSFKSGAAEISLVTFYNKSLRVNTFLAPN